MGDYVMPCLQVNGVDLFYEVTGTGEPLLFLHGLGSSGRDWELQVQAFARDYRVITVDLRGHGRSQKADGSYSIPLFAEDVIALLDHIAPEAVHVVGLSMGGMVALQLALTSPERVRSLTVVNSSAGLNPDSLAEYGQVLVRVFLAVTLSQRQVGAYLANRFFPEPDQALIRRIFIEHWAQNDKLAYLKAMWAIMRWNVVAELPDIDCPSLIIGGDEDYIPLAHKTTMAQGIPDAALVIVPHSRHGTPVDQPARFNAILDDFLQEVAESESREVTTLLVS
jgi:pimeloyl-ACP methyl ester carboxylesterase